MELLEIWHSLDPVLQGLWKILGGIVLLVVLVIMGYFMHDRVESILDETAAEEIRPSMPASCRHSA
jgi:hypothetical protein